MTASVRSHLSAGLAAGLVMATAGAVAVAPIDGPPPITVASPAVDLTALFGPLPALPEVIEFAGVAASPGEWVINAYSVIQPWVEYGVELFAWATEWLPWPIGLLAPQATIIYSGWQPFAESVVYSFAYLLDGEFDLIVPTLTAGIQTGVNNLVTNEIAWILSFFPPLPPIGPLAGFAAVKPAAVRSASSAETVTPAATTAPETVEAATAEVASETAEVAPKDAPEVPAEVAPEVAEVPEPAAVTQGTTRTSHRAAVRAQRQAAAPAAASVSVPEAVPVAGVPDGPAPVAKAGKAVRSGGADGDSGRPARAARGAR